MNPADSPDGGYGSEHRSGSRLHDWRLKAAVQTFLSAVPQGAWLNYLLQRHVTRTLPISDLELEAQVAKAKSNLDAYSRFRRSSQPGHLHMYEFGVGWDLLMPLVYYSMGVDRQTVVDIRPLARVDLVTDIAERLSRAADRLGLVRSPKAPADVRTARMLAERWGIDYRAPADARAIALADGSVDMVTSCDVLEHVPPDDIEAILGECHRLLRGDGLMRIRVDYQDHYWYFDERVSPYNFLRYDERHWQRYNPSLHYQNRIRHSQLLSLISGSGFELLEDDHPQPTSSDLGTLASTALASEFRAMALENVAVRYASLTLQKRTYEITPSQNATETRRAVALHSPASACVRPASRPRSISYRWAASER